MQKMQNRRPQRQGSATEVQGDSGAPATQEAVGTIPIVTTGTAGTGGVKKKKPKKKDGEESKDDDYREMYEECCREVAKMDQKLVF